MKYLRSGLLGLAATAAVLIPAMPAMAAATPSGFTNLPADCTTTLVNNYTTSLTCTNRPDDQKWQADRDCLGVWGLDTNALGNIVTGNGTSTAVCHLRAKPDSLVWFDVVK